MLLVLMLPTTRSKHAVLSAIPSTCARLTMTSVSVINDKSRAAIGLYPSLDGDEPTTYKLKPSFGSMSGMDMQVTYADKSVDTPFLIRGRFPKVAEIRTRQGELLYSVRSKWSFRTHYQAKDSHDKVILDIESNSVVTTNWSATFFNRVSGANERRQLQVDVGTRSATSVVLEGGKVLAVIKRPDWTKRVLSRGLNVCLYV